MVLLGRQGFSRESGTKIVGVSVRNTNNLFFSEQELDDKFSICLRKLELEIVESKERRRLDWLADGLYITVHLATSL